MTNDITFDVMTVASFRICDIMLTGQEVVCKNSFDLYQKDSKMLTHVSN